MSSNSALRTIYRGLLRYNRQLFESGDTLTVRAPLDTFAYQRQQPTWTVNDAGICMLHDQLCTLTFMYDICTIGSRQDIVEQMLPNIVQV